MANVPIPGMLMLAADAKRRIPHSSGNTRIMTTAVRTDLTRFTAFLALGLSGVRRDCGPRQP